MDHALGVHRRGRSTAPIRAVYLDSDAVFRDAVPGGIAFGVTSDTDGDGCRELWMGDSDVVYQISSAAP